MVRLGKKVQSRRLLKAARLQRAAGFAADFAARHAQWQSFSAIVRFSLLQYLQRSLTNNGNETNREFSWVAMPSHWHNGGKLTILQALRDLQDYDSRLVAIP